MRVNSTDFQNAVGKYLALAQKEPVIITKNGRSVARLNAYEEAQEFVVNETKGDYNVKKRISYEEYQEILNRSDQRYELIGGEIYLLASPSFKHQILVRELVSCLQGFLQPDTCEAVQSPFDVRLFGHATKFSEDPNVVQPDLVVICDLEKLTPEGKYEGIPTLVVEVLSPSTRGKDLITKLHLYQRSGIKEYWIVDPEKQTITQYGFNEERELDSHEFFSLQDTLQSKVFPEFRLELTRLFSGTEDY